MSDKIRELAASPVDIETCRWTFDDFHKRYDTSCDDVMSERVAGETPFAFGFVYCPFCGKLIDWEVCE